MAVIADVTAQTLSNNNDMSKNPAILQSSSDRKSNIHEHPFMKEVKYHLSFIYYNLFYIFQFITSGLSVSVANIVTLPSKFILLFIKFIIIYHFIFI